MAFLGPQTVETVDASLKAARRFNDELLSEGKTVNFVVDFGKIGPSTIAANQRALKGMKDLTFHKMAGINAKLMIRFITNSIASVSGDSNRARHFANRGEAEAWLAQE